MIVEEVARLTGTLKFNVDNRPLVAFEKKLIGVTNLLKQFGAAANKKFNIKVTLDAKSLREQLDKATAARITFKNLAVSQEALGVVSKKISDRLNRSPIRLTHVKVDVASLISQKHLIRTLLGQMSIDLPISVRFKSAEAMLRSWKKNTEDRFTLRLNADISQARFIANVRKSLRAAASKIGTLQIKVTDPKLKLSVDQANLRAQIRAAISAHEFDVRVRVRRGAGDVGAGAAGRAGSGVVGGAVGAGMGFMRGAIPGLGAAFAFSQLNRINQQMVAQQNAMTATMGGEAQGAEQSKWVKDLSNKIGMDYRQVAPAYTKMLASGQTSGMSTESVQNIFKGVSEYGRVMGLDNESMKGSMKAIEQMMNKGQVMSEELKSQLAERMPGAMSAMAEAAGFGKGSDAVAKLMDAMKRGTVKSDKVLEEFGNILATRARVGGALDKAMISTAAEQMRMNNAFSDAVVIFSAAGFDKGMGEFFRSMAEAMRDAEPGIESLGKAFEILIEPINAIISVGGSLLEILPKVGELFGLTGGQMAALGITAGLLLTPFGAVVGAIGAIALAIEDLIVYSEGGESVFGTWVESSTEAKTALDELSTEATKFGDNIKMALEQAGLLGGALEGLSFPEMLTATMKELTMLMKLFNDSIDRFVAAGQYSRATNESGGALEANARNIVGLAMGPDWVNAQLWGKYGAESLDSTIKSSGESLTSQSQLALLTEIRDKIATTDATRIPPISVSMPVTIEGGGTGDAATLGAIALMPGMVQEAFKDVLSNAMIGLKEIR